VLIPADAARRIAANIAKLPELLTSARWMRCGFPTTPFQKSEKTHKLKWKFHRLSRSRNSLATVGGAFSQAYLLRRGAYEKVRVDEAWSCGRDAHISVRCI
jgi:hypothetical protein